jgi:hypothetical protein
MHPFINPRMALAQSKGQNMNIVAVIIAVILPTSIVGLFAYFLCLSEGAEGERR